MKYTITIPNQPDSIIDIDIPKTVNNVAVMFSGGTDSTLLLSLLQMERLKQNFELTAYTVENNLSIDFHCKEILKNPFFSNVKHVSDISNAKRFDGIIRIGIGIVLRMPEVEMVFTGASHLPPIPISGAPDPIRKEDILPFSKLRCPLIETSKDYIIQAFYQIPELKNLDLLRLTHSCTSLPRGRCGYCFQCKEKEWAFSQLGKELIMDS